MTYGRLIEQAKRLFTRSLAGEPAPFIYAATRTRLRKIPLT